MIRTSLIILLTTFALVKKHCIIINWNNRLIKTWKSVSVLLHKGTVLAISTFPSSDEPSSESLASLLSSIESSSLESWNYYSFYLFNRKGKKFSNQDFALPDLSYWLTWQFHSRRYLSIPSPSSSANLKDSSPTNF